MRGSISSRSILATEALENIAVELERLRILREHELGVRVEDEEGSLWVRTVERD